MTSCSKVGKTLQINDGTEVMVDASAVDQWPRLLGPGALAPEATRMQRNVVRPSSRARLEVPMVSDVLGKRHLRLRHNGQKKREHVVCHDETISCFREAAQVSAARQVARVQAGAAIQDAVLE